MKLLTCLLAAGLLIMVGVSPAQAGGADVAGRTALGINLAGPADWNTEQPFVDVFRMSRKWISQREGGDWGKGPTLELDEHGWVKRLEPGAYAETLMLTIDEPGHLPTGTYTVFHEGQGELEMGGAASNVQRGESGRLTFDVGSNAKGPVNLKIRKTDPDDYIRNIRVVMPGFADTYETQVFTPAFLERWQGMACIRFMDWMHTNNSTVASWDDRPKVADATWVDGIPAEVMIDLSNRAGVAPWFCMPLNADDDYVKRFAELVKAELKPGLPVYVELSNELWNGGFKQSHEAQARGQALSLADKPWVAGWHYTARRSVEVFGIWEQVFGGSDRLVRVLAAQAANAFIAKQIVQFEDAHKHADALAIAPYISFNVPSKAASKGHGYDAETVASWPVEQVLDYVENTALPESIEHIKAHKAVADEYGLALIAYEGGQHLVGIQGANANKQLTDVFKQANGHERMGKVYTDYLDAWKDAGGGTFALWLGVGRWTQWGSWGLMEYHDSDPADSPKYQAVLQWMENNSADPE